MINILEEARNRASQAMSKRMDTLTGWLVAELINQPTVYRGKGRPRKTDYAIYKHPDGQTKKVIYRKA